MKAKLLRDAGRITKGEAVDIVTKEEPSHPDEAAPEYNVRDDAGHEETVVSSDFEIIR